MELSAVADELIEVALVSISGRYPQFPENVAAAHLLVDSMTAMEGLSIDDLRTLACELTIRIVSERLPGQGRQGRPSAPKADVPDLSAVADELIEDTLKALSGKFAQFPEDKHMRYWYLTAVATMEGLIIDDMKILAIELSTRVALERLPGQVAERPRGSRRARRRARRGD